MLNGNLSTLSLPDLLQLLSGIRKSGCLQIERRNVFTRLYFREGRVVACSSNDPPKLLGQFLLFRGVITEDALRDALALQETTGTSLRKILLETGSVDRSRLDEEIASKAEETILDLFSWSDACFWFVENAALDPGAMDLYLEVERLVLEGMRRLDEQERIHAVFPDTSVVIRRPASQAPPPLPADGAMREIHAAIDGRRTIDEIILHAHGTRHMVMKGLSELYRDGLIETSDAVSKAPPDQASADGEDPPDGGGARELPAVDPPDLAPRRDPDVAASVFRLQQDFPPWSVPVPAGSLESLVDQDLSPTESFLVSLIKERKWDVKTILWIAPMQAMDVLKSLRTLQEKRLIVLEDPSAAADDQKARSPSTARRSA